MSRERTVKGTKRTALARPAAQRGHGGRTRPLTDAPQTCQASAARRAQASLTAVLPVKNVAIDPMKGSQTGIARLRHNRLELPALRHRHHRGAGDNEVIEQPHINERQGLLHGLGQLPIRLTGFGQTRRMVVGHHESGRIMP